MRKSLICVLALSTIVACKDDQNKTEKEVAVLSEGDGGYFGVRKTICFLF